MASSGCLQPAGRKATASPTSACLLLLEAPKGRTGHRVLGSGPPAPVQRLAACWVDSSPWKDGSSPGLRGTQKQGLAHPRSPELYTQHRCFRVAPLTGCPLQGRPEACLASGLFPSEMGQPGRCRHQGGASEPSGHTPTYVLVGGPARSARATFPQPGGPLCSLGGGGTHRARRRP